MQALTGQQGAAHLSHWVKLALPLSWPASAGLALLRRGGLQRMSWLATGADGCGGRCQAIAILAVLALVGAVAGCAVFSENLQGRRGGGSVMMGVLYGAGTAVLAVQQHTRHPTGAQGRGHVLAVEWDRGRKKERLCPSGAWDLGWEAVPSAAHCRCSRDRGLTLMPDCSPSSHQQRRTSSIFTRSSSGGLCTGGARAD